MEESSYGVIPFTKTKGRAKILLVKQRNGAWSFPKGHKENNETDKETALRELEEETSLKISADRLLDSPILSSHYFFMRDALTISKKCFFYLASFDNEMGISIPAPFAHEIEEIRWVEIREARKLLHFKSMEQVLNTCEEFFKD